MNFGDKPIDEALRNLQEVFQITVSPCRVVIWLILYGMSAVNGSVTCYLILQGEAQLIERIVSVRDCKRLLLTIVQASIGFDFLIYIMCICEYLSN